MKNQLFLCFIFIIFTFHSLAQETEELPKDSIAKMMEDLEKDLKYKRDTTIQLDEGNGSLKVVKGFKYLTSTQAQFVLTQLWGNPEDKSVLGLLVPENVGVLDSNAWLYVLSYDEMGYVDDKDALKINYDDLLKDMQADVNTENEARKKEGYEPVELVRWASPPYYDKEKKVLHWAKELKFGESNINTMNYNLRVLGRKGVYVINAVASIDQLAEVKATIPNVLEAITFNSGHAYTDFDPKLDKVAAYGIGGLVAGKVLAKAGFLAMLLKFWKILLLLPLLFWKYIKNLFNKNRGENNSDQPSVNDDKNELAQNTQKHEDIDYSKIETKNFSEGFVGHRPEDFTGDLPEEKKPKY
jgi:uncharacterized membrane-anchored protein